MELARAPAAALPVKSPAAPVAPGLAPPQAQTSGLTGALTFDFSGTPAQATAATAATPTAPRIVGDEATAAAGTQMRRSEFLVRLRETVTQAAAAALGPEWSADDCPYIERWFAEHAGDDPAALDRMARRYTGLQAPDRAADYLEPIAQRLTVGIQRWRAGQDIAGELASAGLSAAAKAVAGFNPGSARDGAASVAGELGPGRPLEAKVAAVASEAWGTSLDQVRIHTEPSAAAAADRLDARAFAVGPHIGFAADAYQPGTPVGDAIIAHELAHVVQQQNTTASPAALLARQRRSDEGAQERDADQAAGSVLGRLYSQAASHVGPALRAPLGISRCKNDNPAPATAGKTAVVGPVKFQATDPVDRIPPSKTATVPVKLEGLPSGSNVDFDIEGSGGGNGTASVTAGARLSASGNVEVKGGTQTDAGKKEQLKLRAKIGGTEVGKSPGFSVAAWPINFTDTFSGDIDNGTLVGLRVQDGWSSDGGGTIATELTEVRIAESVGEERRDNPPFTVALGDTETSEYLEADAPSTDSHAKRRDKIALGGLAHGTYLNIRTQVSIFKDARTGVTDLVMPSSGLKINHAVTWNAATNKWNQQTTKVAADVTVLTFHATPGRCTGADGTAVISSAVHVL